MKRVLKVLILSFFCSCLSVSPAGGGELNRSALRSASVRSEGRLQIIRQEGTPYEMGYQHGFLLQEEVKEMVDSALSSLAARVKVPWLGRRIVNHLLDTSYRRMEPFIPRDFQEELRGVAEGSGVALQEIRRFHMIPERFPFLGSSFVAYGEATEEHKLLQMKNLDWDLRIGIQQRPVLFVCRPENRLPFVTMGVAGYIGVFSGLNRQGISVSAMGAKGKDETVRGTPMPFLLRQVLEESYELEDAVTIVNKAPRTGGYNYLFADAVRQNAVALETTQKLCVAFYREDAFPLPDYGIALKEAMVRSETALDPLVREQQTCSNGKPGRPGLEPPSGSAYETGYRKQAIFVRNNYGGITAEVAQLIAREVATSTNLQSVLYAYPEFWVAYAEGKTAAAKTRSWHFRLDELF